MPGHSHQPAVSAGRSELATPSLGAALRPGHQGNNRNRAGIAACRAARDMAERPQGVHRPGRRCKNIRVRKVRRHRRGGRGRHRSGHRAGAKGVSRRRLQTRDRRIIGKIVRGLIRVKRGVLRRHPPRPGGGRKRPHGPPGDDRQHRGRGASRPRGVLRRRPPHKRLRQGPPPGVNRRPVGREASRLRVNRHRQYHGRRQLDSNGSPSGARPRNIVVDREAAAVVRGGVRRPYGKELSRERARRACLGRV